VRFREGISWGTPPGGRALPVSFPSPPSPARRGSNSGRSTLLRSAGSSSGRSPRTSAEALRRQQTSRRDLLGHSPDFRRLEFGSEMYATQWH